MDKQCGVCGEVKPLSEFYANAEMRDGHRNDCKACNSAAHAARHAANPQPGRARARQWQQDNPERYAANQARYRDDGRRSASNRRSHLKRTFGISVGEYDAMLESQAGGCAICHRPPRSDISLHVDHDHDSGRIRGLLCFDCNAGLGKFREDPSLLAAAVT